MISAAIHGAGNPSSIPSGYYQPAFGGSTCLGTGEAELATSTHYQRAFEIGEFTSNGMQQHQQQQQRMRSGGINTGSCTNRSPATPIGNNRLVTSSSSSSNVPNLVAARDMKHGSEHVNNETITNAYKPEPEPALSSIGGESLAAQMLNDRRSSLRRREMLSGGNGSDETGSSLYDVASPSSNNSSDDECGINSVGNESPSYRTAANGVRHQGALTSADGTTCGAMQVMGGPGDTCEEGNGHHVLAPGSPAHGPGRHCLLWACKACKKKTVTVDRRKVHLFILFLFI